MASFCCTRPGNLVLLYLGGHEGKSFDLPANKKNYFTQHYFTQQYVTLILYIIRIEPTFSMQFVSKCSWN